MLLVALAIALRESWFPIEVAIRPAHLLTAEPWPNPGSQGDRHAAQVGSPALETPSALTQALASI